VTREDAAAGRGSCDRPARVLIIDDNPSTVLSLKTFVEDHGYEGICAMTARDGLEMVRRARPDLILLDIVMEAPYSGFHVCSALKADPELRHIPIIGISGIGESLGIRYCPETDREFFNPDAYVGKPVDYEELLARMQCLLGSAVSRGEP
jgi:CheY-like chemotaxis protein